MDHSPYAGSVYRTLGALSALVAISLVPPVFERLLAPSPLLSADRAFLWVLATVIAGMSVVLLRAEAPRFEKIAAIHFGVLLLSSIELTTRFVVCAFFPEQQVALARIGRLAYPELAAYAAHPFVQFTGNPNSEMVEGRVLGPSTVFNNFGFHGQDFAYEKPEGVVRIAALGGSTTATGYPLELGNYLNQRWDETDHRFEALNFGLGWYNTAHSLANFVFTVRDLSPDYVIIHHATNEKDVRNFSTGFRGDYSHALKAFDAPVLGDWALLRLSVVYRYARYRTAGPPPQIELTQATRRREGDVTEARFSKLQELAPFRRNIETIIDLALIDGIMPLLTTQPYRSVPVNEWETWTPHMRQANDILREIASEYGERILFVDLDQMMTGMMDDLFVDIVHVNDEGRRLKARSVGESILEHIRRSGAAG